MIFNTPATTSKGILHNQEIDTTIAYSLHQRYRSGIRSLIYLVRHSRPELSNTVCELSKFMDEANMSHYKSLLCAMKYIFDKKECF